ncbi:MAG TPA: EAL domain-containing protein [Solirubrobacteraceae bacterium]|jgi:diguanylate cyclase (GGDEF)-like protein|nr:EAL domain-containing protein [Solirubrobacteraceae bacterium]
MSEDARARKLDEVRAPVPPSVPGEQPAADLPRLGEALKARADEVLELTVARSTGPGHEVDALVQESFERLGRSSTVAVARWMVGEGLAVAREAGEETWRIFGELAAHRAASLHEVTRRCLMWRNSMVDVLRESAAQLGASAEALTEALHILQLSLEFSFVRMAECFDAERRRADEELAKREGELAFMATHDALTGLPNRTLIKDRVEQMLGRARRKQTQMAALFIDIDNFKSINDSLGHAVGDELLRAVAARLDGVVRGSDALGRLGGDEFVVISEDLSLGAGPELIAERLLEALKLPFKLGEDRQTRVTVTASIGIALGERACAEELLREADIAMYRAKWDGKNRYAVFESDMQDTIKGRMELEMDLREALANDEFYLDYQPTFDLGDMTPNGVEALIRWKHPRRGIVQPDDFIPLLEETGLIIEIGSWVLGRACNQGAAWRRAGYPIRMAVNVSARQLDTDGLIADVEGALQESGLEPVALTIEITETTLMRNVQETVRRLSAIKQLGVRIAIDDFGTGYSSLAHLQQFPVDALKIDRSFITGLHHNQEGETLIHTLVQLGKALSIETFAEGIEQQHELTLLRAQDCDSGQGFLFARPLDVAATETFLREWHARAAAATAADALDLTAQP